MLATDRPHDVQGFAFASGFKDYKVAMSCNRAIPLDLSNASPPRIPKLLVRNRLPVDVDYSRSSYEGSSEDVIRSERGRKDVVQPGIAYSRHGSERSLRAEPRLQRKDSKISKAGHTTGRSAKRKSAGLLGFLALKEPSTSALEEFAEQERKRAAQKTTKANVAVVLPGVSSQKLPDYVPKVNSKWDGLPESSKRGSGIDNVKRDSMVSLASSGGNDASKRPNGSSSGASTAQQFQDNKRVLFCEAEVPVSASPNADTTSRSSPVPNATYPVLRHIRGQLSDELRSQASLHSQTPPPSFKLDPPIDSVDSGPAEVPTSQDRVRASGDSAFPETSPRSPTLDMAMFSASNPMTPPGLEKARIPSDTTSNILIGDSEIGSCRPLLRSVSPVVENVATENAATSSIVTSKPVSPAPRRGSGMIRNFSYPRHSTPSSHSARGPTRSTSSSQLQSAPTPGLTLTHSCAELCATSTTLGTKTGSSSDSSGKTAMVSSSVQAVIKPAAPLTKSDKNEVLPWEMYEPPPEPSVARRPARDISRLKRFSRFGKK